MNLSLSLEELESPVEPTPMCSHSPHGSMDSSLGSTVQTLQDSFDSSKFVQLSREMLDIPEECLSSCSLSSYEIHLEEDSEMDFSKGPEEDVEKELKQVEMRIQSTKEFIKGGKRSRRSSNLSSISSSSSNSSNDRTLYGGYRVNLANEAKVLAEKIGNDIIQGKVKPKKPNRNQLKTLYQRKWETMFGKHTAKCHPKSLFELIRREGKPIVFLIVLGLVASVLDYAIDMGISGVKLLQTMALEEFTSYFPHYLYHLSIWCLLMTLGTFLSVYFTHSIDPIAAGSGIPEMKTILSSDLRKEPERYLKFKTLIAKSIGLIFAIGIGLSIGREGPFVHIASIICHLLMTYLPCFHTILNNHTVHRHMYSAACAVGVASTFAAPIGGVLFSIEVTSTFFLVSDYWRGFIAAVSGSMIKKLMDYVRFGITNPMKPMFPTQFDVSASFHYYEIALYAITGVLMGFLGAAYVRLSQYCRKKWYRWNHQYPYRWSFCIGLLVACLMYIPGMFPRLSFHTIIQNLCSNDTLPSIWSPSTIYNYYWTLPLLGTIQFFLTIFCTALPIPAGDFLPLFIVGASFGRWIGEIILWLHPFPTIVPGGYALVGGTALVASVTHTVSVAVIVLEFTGQFVYMTPLLITSLIGCGISRGLSVSIYNAILIHKGLPYLPMLRCDQMVEMTAKDVMLQELQILPQHCQISDLKEMYQRTSYSSLPIVNNLEDRLFLGCLKRKELEEFLLQVKPEATLEDETKDLNSEKQGILALSPHCSSSKNPPLVRPLTLTKRSISLPFTRKSDIIRPSIPSSSFPMHEDDPEPLTTCSSMDMDLIHCEAFAVDHTSLLVDEFTPIEQVHMLFEMLKCSHLFVHSRGRLNGVITRRSLYFRLHYIDSIKQKLKS